MNERICKGCGDKFMPKSSRQLYCKKEIIKKCPVCGDDFVIHCQPENPTTCPKPECKKKASYIGSINKIKKCEICGQEFKPTSSTQQYCNKPVKRICQVCGNQFTIKCTAEEYKIQTCSDKCMNKLAAQHREAAYMSNHTAVCKLCGKEFHPRTNTQVVCERKHFRNCVVCGKEFELNYKKGMNLDDLRKTCSEECFRKQYKGKNPFSNPESLEKYRKTSLERYGVTHPMQSKEVKDRVFASYEDRTGFDHPAHNPNTLIGKQFNVSSLERKLANALTNNQIEFETQKQVSNNNIVHKFDFYLPKYNIYIDVDGEYYHGYLDDSNGNQVSEDRDAVRSYLIELTEMYFVITEVKFKEKVEELLDVIRSIDTDAFNYDEYMFNWCRSIEFPYPIYKDDRLLRDYNNLCKYECNKYNSHAKLGMSSIRHFHKSIYDAHVGNNKSIKEAWEDDNILKKVIKNRMLYKNDIDPSKILAGFYISKIVPKVSIFNPVLARYLTNKYLSNYSEVLDPFSGFSGRLLGVTSCNKRYVGSDLNEKAVSESNQIINFHSLDAEISCKNILESESLSGQCLLTCPPYGKKETYSIEITYKSCDEWINIILSKYHCNRYVFVVEQTSEFKDNIQEEIITKSYFNNITEYVIVIDQ